MAAEGGWGGLNARKPGRQRPQLHAALEGQETMPPSMLTINGAALPFESGQTILQAARRAGIAVPTL